jgi:UDP-glucose 4-epimerase
MRIGVTGGAGFLGSHVSDALVLAGHDTVVLDLPGSVVPNDRTFVAIDVTRQEGLAEALAGCEAVFHCAAVADLGQARQDPRRALEVNVMGTLNILEAAASAGARRFMHASSVYALSGSGSVYRTSKQASERLVQDLSNGLDLSSTILRFGSLYGPRSDEHNAIRRMVHQAIRENRIDFWGDGSEVREYIHVRDAAALAIVALDSQYVDQALHITGQERITTLQLMETIKEMLGGTVEITLRDEPFEGRYRLTPYSLETVQGMRMTSTTYVDLGLGLLESLREAQEQR